MASVKVKYRPSMTAEREGKVYFQIIHERVVRQWSSDYKIFNNEWDVKKHTIIASSDDKRHSYLMSIRERIKWDVERFKRIIAEFSSKRDSFTADEIVNEFSLQYNQLSFFCFMESVIIKLKRLGKLRTSETYISALNSFRQYREGKDVIFDEFDSELMEAYEASLSMKGLIPNSISFHMRILRAVYNRAIEKGITENKHPFRHVYTGVDKTTKRAIDLNKLRKIKDADFIMLPNVDYARDMFLLSFFLRGMSFVDMAYLRKVNLLNGQITYRRRKTGQQLSIKWTKEMQSIVDKYPPNETEYLLPIITSISASHYYQYKSQQYLINKNLKVVAKYVGLKMPLTMYCSRHSWASIAKAKGIPVGVISDGLGHDSELTTQIYLSTLDTSAVDRANGLIIRML